MIFILAFISMSLSSLRSEENFTKVWSYHSQDGKTHEVRIAKATSPTSQEFEYRDIKWTKEGAFPVLANIVQSTPDGVYRAVYHVTRQGGELVENLQFVLMTQQAYQNILSQLSDSQTRRKYGLPSYCPEDANAVWVVHNIITNRTEGYCLTPSVTTATTPPAQKRF